MGDLGALALPHRQFAVLMAGPMFRVEDRTRELAAILRDELARLAGELGVGGSAGLGFATDGRSGWKEAWVAGAGCAPLWTLLTTLSCPPFFLFQGSMVRIET